MRKLRDNSITVFILAIILMIIIPLSTVVIDMMYIINIGLSVIILLTTMYIEETLEFDVFPSLLLVTTLFRLSLSVSSTRLILTNSGDAGRVIDTFGNFVLGGNPVAGFVIFIIIVLTQVVVITKGAERISEVTARFTLDAMPGKQMSIDADLSSGAITEAEASIKREKVQRESDFYGAMDGAMKFVKGDSTMSIITTAINFIGGLIVGMVQGGGDFGAVMDTYATATVGSGLVSQIPSLLITTAASMIITRAASKQSLNLDLKDQFTTQPMVLIISGLTLMVLGLMPGFPKVQVFIIGILLIVTGLALNKAKDEKQVIVEDIDTDVEVEVTDDEYYKNIDNVYELIQVDPITLEIGFSLIPLVDEESGGNFINRVILFRKQFAREMGMVVPSVTLKDNGYLNPNEYVIQLKGQEIARGEVLVDYLLALDNGGTTGEIDGIETVEPAYGIPGKWITKDKRDIAEIYGYSVIDSLSVLIMHLSESIRNHSHELLSRQDVVSLVENTKKDNEQLVKEVVPDIVTYGDLQKILCNLLRENIPIKDMGTILETISNYGSAIKDTDTLTEYIRQSLKRVITHKLSKNGQIKVITLSPSLEKTILTSVSKNDSGSYLNIDQDTIQNIITQLNNKMSEAKRKSSESPIILTSPFIRGYFKKFLEQFYIDVDVISFSEIENSVQIQAIANIDI